ncbi:hypothetical protein [Hymenobacter fodinae]|uniref:Uncharacterized protein n=1 Tax=Hymenobacter fodinae TaxID=2510796 RepID=A0A4Z0P2A3_9BACT|nr:hypothetical protein [Hymenobacter fodinae]TGE05371.1 hypothetical protein EU556_18865 [Hymenobacter fodinae]
MTLSRRAASLLSGLLLLAAGSRAQTPLGQPTLDEQKVQIWCATARYVYDDNGRSNLKGRLNCGSSLSAFESSIKADSQRVYSALYQPLEGKGTMYKGLGSNSSRLQKLTTEIINRLKASPARRANPARMQRLATLEAALNNYVQNGTPIGELSNAEVATEQTDTTTTSDDTMSASPSDAGLAEAGVASTPTAVNNGAGESLMNKFFGPLALILSLLSLVLYALLRRSITALGDRLGRHRSEIDSVKNGVMGSSASLGTASADRLTPAQQREVEILVQQRVEEELKKLRGQTTAAPTPAAAPTAKPAGQSARPAPVAPPAPAAPAPAPPRPITPAPVAAPVYSAPSAATEVPVTPPVIPVGAPSASPRDEFESLVPPVQLPSPAASVAPAAPAEPIASAAAVQQTRYVKVPVNGAFNEYDFSDEPQHDSIYEIHLDPQWPELATFSVTSNPAVHAYAIQSAQYSLREACKYQQPTGPVTRIITEEEGVLRKVAGNWQIEQKAAIRFE